MAGMARLLAIAGPYPGGDGGIRTGTATEAGIGTAWGFAVRNAARRRVPAALEPVLFATPVAPLTDDPGNQTLLTGARGAGPAHGAARHPRGLPS